MLRLWLITLLWGGLGPIVYGTEREPVVLREPVLESIALGTKVEYAFDPQLSFDPRSPETAKGLSWQASTQDTASFGYQTGAVWLRLRINDQRPQPSPLVVKLNYPPLDQIDAFFLAEGRWHQWQAGDHIPKSSWAMRFRTMAFPLPATQDGSAIDLYIRTQSSSSLILPLQLLEREAFEEQVMREETIQSLYFGALLILGLYNLLIYLSSRLAFYGSYVLFILGYGILQASFGGQIHHYIYDQIPNFNDLSVLIGTALACIGLTLFVLSVFELEARPRLRRLWRLCGRTIVAWGVIDILVILFLPYGLAMQISYFCAFITLCYSVASALLALQEKERMARWFLLAWSAFFLGTLAVILRGLGLVPVNTWTNYSQQIGSAIEFTLLSFAMADRIKILQEKINIEREHALLAEQAAREADQRALAASEAALTEQTRLSELKDQFLANTSHELRTPLNGMIGMSESLLAHNSLRDNERASLQEILAASRRLAKLVGEIMDFSASRQGQIQLLWEQLSLHQLLSEALITQREAFPDKPIQVINELPDNGLAIHADRSRVLQVLNAVLSNAYKFMDQGRIIIKGRIDEQAVELVLRDTGPGIAKSQLQELLNGFAQGDGSAARKQGGTGLGLALAQKLMLAQKGSLEIQSVPGLGTTVLLRFVRSEAELAFIPQPIPLAAVSSDNNIAYSKQGPRNSLESRPLPGTPNRIPALSLAPSSHSPKAQPRLDVLVVDDDELNRRVLREHLQGERFEVHEAASGQEALHLFEQHIFAAVLLDVMMPGMTGYQVCQILRQSHSQTDLPVLMLTAKQQVEDLLAGFQAGANDYVLKPFVRDELLARLSTHLNISQTARAMQRFVPQDYIRLLGHESLRDVALGEVVEQSMVILFTDIVGFTSILETMAPRDAFAWLNNCYRVLGPEIRRFGGVVDKYIGDAVMALFPDSPDAALQAAISMHQGAASLDNVHLGSGLHFGQTMLGTLGEPERFEATVLSDAVNIASRVEGAAKIFGCQIVVTAYLKAALKNPQLIEWRRLGRVRFKGRDGAIELFEVLSADPYRELKIQTRDEFERGVQCFEKAAFMEASMHFQTVQDINGADLAADFYLRRIKTIMESKVSDFDGVLNLLTKS